MMRYGADRFSEDEAPRAGITFAPALMPDSGPAATAGSNPEQERGSPLMLLVYGVTVRPELSKSGR